MSYALDASAIIAHLDANDAHYEAVHAVLSQGLDEPLLAHPLTIAECLVASVRKGQGAAMVDAIETMGVQVVDVDDGAPMRLADLRVATGLRMPDCCAIDVARAHTATFVTFDDRQAAAAHGLGVEVARVPSPPTGSAPED